MFELICILNNHLDCVSCAWILVKFGHKKTESRITLDKNDELFVGHSELIHCTIGEWMNCSAYDKVSSKMVCIVIKTHGSAENSKGGNIGFYEIL